MKRIFIILIVLGAVIGVTIYGYQRTTPAKPQNIQDDPNIEIVTVERETLVDTVDATGRIEPKAEVNMKFQTGGRVKEVLVQAGQYITAGTVLAHLDTSDLEFSVRNAEIDLTQSEAELQKLFEDPLPEEIAAAEARVESTRLDLAELQEGPDQDEIAKAEAALRLQEVELQDAQWAYDQVAYKGDIGTRPEARTLQEATLNYESALADYNLAVEEPTEAEIASAKASFAEARSSLAQLREEPSEADIASVQASVEKAKLALEEAVNDLEDGVLVAPTDGIILDVNIEPGERVLNEADEAAVLIANTSAFLLKVNVDEIDIGQIQRNQKTLVTLDAFSEEGFEGEVIDISPSPVEDDTNGLVTYEVTIGFKTGDKDMALLPGMTANAAIETNRLSRVTVVPSRAIQFDRETTPATIYVEKLGENGDPVRVEVELGMRDGEVTEVISGVEVGDEIIIRTEPDEFGSSPDL